MLRNRSHVVSPASHQSQLELPRCRGLNYDEGVVSFRIIFQPLMNRVISFKIMGFLSATILCGFILHLLPFDENRLAAHRLHTLATSEDAWKNEVTSHCAFLTTRQGAEIENLFLLRLPHLSSVHGGCPFTIGYTRELRFYVRTQWAMDIRIETGDKPFHRTFFFETLRPMVLWPIAAFLFALLFDIRMWGLGLTVFLHLFFLGGLNPIPMTNLIIRSGVLTLTDETLIGLALCLLWSSLVRAQTSHIPVRFEKTRKESLINRLLALAIGLWNPIFYTLLGRHLFPLRARRGAIAFFLDSQLVLAALSLYLLSFQDPAASPGLGSPFLLPRYFSFAVLFCLANHFSLSRTKPQVCMWHSIATVRTIAFIVGVEAIGWGIPQVRELNVLTRVGLALVLSAFLGGKWQWAKAVGPFVKSLGFLFLSLFLATSAGRSGLIDTLLFLCVPNVNSGLSPLVTFTGAVVVGVVVGGFPHAFFPLVVFLNFPEAAQLKAALLDGVLVGIWLSPFSLFNLLPVHQFRLSLSDLLHRRFKQLFIPFMIGCIVYGLGAVYTVAILQPVTFIFCCLVALAVRLRNQLWELGQQAPKSP